MAVWLLKHNVRSSLMKSLYPCPCLSYSETYLYTQQSSKISSLPLAFQDRAGFLGLNVTRGVRLNNPQKRMHKRGGEQGGGEN